MSRWTRSDVIALSSLIVATVVSIINGVAQPEVRCFFGLQSESCPSSQTTPTLPRKRTQNDEQPKSSPPISTIEPSPKSSTRELTQNNEKLKSPPPIPPSQPRTTLISKARGWWIWIRQELGKWWMWLVGVVVLVFVALLCKKNTGHLLSAQRPAPPSVPLRSARGVDYTQLRARLAAGEWREADEKTADLMLQAAGRESEGWLDFDAINNFPCEDLRTINQLWLHYSKGKFGFSVQKEIYESYGGTRYYNKRVWENFCDRIGWRKGGKLVGYSDLTFGFKAPKAHRPGVWILCGWRVGVVGRREMYFSSLAQRLVTCKI